MLSSGKGRIGMFENQTPKTLTQGAPVQNTWYEALPETALCRVYGFGICIEDADETLQVRVTIDGIASTPADITATHSTPYYIIRKLDAINRTVTYDQVAATPPLTFMCEGKKVKIEVRKTTALGAGNLQAVVDYGVLKDVPI